MKLETLKANEGATKRRKRVGRGNGSGLGKTSGRGHKGQLARSGGKSAVGFEGGQTPLIKRIPKRGFNNYNHINMVTVNVHQLNVFEDGDIVSIEALQSKGLISNPKDGVKVLGTGELERKLTVQVNAFSETAKEKIEEAGGKAEVI